VSEQSLKPWSEVDEEAEIAVVDEGSPEVDVPPSLADEEAHASGATAHRAKLEKRLSGLRVGPSCALAPMALAVGWLVYAAAASSSSSTGLPVAHALGIGSLILVAGAVIVLSRFARRGEIARMISSLGSGAADASGPLAIAPRDLELQSIWQMIDSHTANVQRHLAELLESHRQVSLELTLADTQKRQWACIIDVLPEPVLATDMHGQLIQANSAAGTLFGFSLDEALRKPLEEAISDERLCRLVKQSREAGHRAAERRSEVEINGQVFAAMIVPLDGGQSPADGAQVPHGIVVMLRDITREREVSKKKSEFVASAAHELRTPLASIRAYVEMLVDGEAADEDTQREYYNIIDVSAERLGRMIDNMLNISRIEAGTVRISKEPIPISMIVKEAVDVIRPQATEKDITLIAHLTPVVNRVMADRDLIYQAVLNLASNAVKYTPAGGMVTVRMTPNEQDKKMLIEVVDTGVGIPKADLPKMFTKFFRVEVNKKLAKGTGLGLNLVKKIVEQVHEGAMTLDSEEGKGSTFGMILPMVD